eukprot:gene112-643_t
MAANGSFKLERRMSTEIAPAVLSTTQIILSVGSLSICVAVLKTFESNFCFNWFSSWFNWHSVIFGIMSQRFSLANLVGIDASVHPEAEDVIDIASSRRPSVSKNYLRALTLDEDRRVSPSQPARSSLLSLAGEQFPMHCVKIQDLLDFDKLPDHDTVKAMGKLVVPGAADKRPILFVSHQWLGFTHPDPTNQQFEVLKGALRSLLSGRDVYPDAFVKTHHGIPKKLNFASLLQDCLVWLDFLSVPQLNGERKSQSDDIDESCRLQDMLNAINSISVYIQRCDLMLVLAPVVAHFDNGTECQLSSWKSRGWCRLEAIVSSLVGPSKFIVIVESEVRMVIYNVNQMLTRDSVGCGEFSCCTQGHVIDVNGVPTETSCDKTKISDVLSSLVHAELKKRVQKKDLADYRWILAHEHVILRNLPCLDRRPELKTWYEFANAFHLHGSGPLKKVGGKHNWAPLAYAILANNFPIVKYLIQRKADVNNTKCGKYCPLHLIMKVGYDESGKNIFDALLTAKADPYKFAWGGSIFRKPYYRDPFNAGVYAFNSEMCAYYMDRVKTNFQAIAHPLKFTNALVALSVGQYSVVSECLKHTRADFQSFGAWRTTNIGLFSMIPRAFVYAVDTRCLDLLHEHGLLPDLNTPMHAERGPVVWSWSIMWSLREIGLFKRNDNAAIIHCIGWGTYYHAAIYRDKPEIVAWLLRCKANPKITNRRGQTALDLAKELGHSRCVALLQ